MWVFEEVVNGTKLTEWINSTHENTKYLPGHKLPENLRAVPDIVEACRGADLLVFVMPHQFVAVSTASSNQAHHEPVRPIANCCQWGLNNIAVLC